VSELDDAYDCQVSVTHSYSNNWCVFVPDKIGAFLAQEKTQFTGTDPLKWQWCSMTG